MLGKRGEKPPLPCNCKRPFFDCKSHCPSRVGRRSRREVGRESGDRSRQAHSPLFLGRRRTCMFVSLIRPFRLVVYSALLAMLCASSLRAQSPATLHGEVLDPLGRSVPNAKIVLLQNGKEIVRGKSEADGSFALSVPSGGRYTPRIEAAGFATQTLPVIILIEGKTKELSISLQIGPLPQRIVVSATGTAVPEDQEGASRTGIYDPPVQGRD